MTAQAGRQGLYKIFCGMYISIGVCSLALGCYMLHLSHVLGKQSPKGIDTIAWILIAFGPIRIGNSLWVLRKIKKRSQLRKPDPKV